MNNGLPCRSGHARCAPQMFCPKPGKDLVAKTPSPKDSAQQSPWIDLVTERKCSHIHATFPFGDLHHRFYSRPN